jgi:hypothetical protein
VIQPTDLLTSLPWRAGSTVLVIVLAALALSLVLAIAGAWPALAAAPEVTAAPVIQTGDPRSDGAGPGIIGSPLAIIAAVVVLGLATAVTTFVLAHLTQRG